jgi:murein DD-endopeptidase MepM/ murein hydrolase activator NlpD
MPRPHHTVIFVPHAHAKLRKWRVTNLQIGLAAGTFLFLSLTATFFIRSYFHTSTSPAELSRLQGENERLRQANLEFESSLRSLQTQLSDYEDRTRQLAIVAGVDSLGAGAEGGVGGGEPLDDIGTDPETVAPDAIPPLAQMTDHAAQLKQTLDAVEAKLEERLLWISSTPAIAPVKGILSSGFGFRSDPMTHGRGVHQGVDIVAATGQPVRASADGIVMRATTMGGYGNAVFLAHGFGVTTRYGHLSRIEVRPGQRVKRGDIIGRVGSTGRSTGPHLHYEVRIDGEPVNPLAYILDDTEVGP